MRNDIENKSRVSISSQCILKNLRTYEGVPTSSVMQLGKCLSAIIKKPTDNREGAGQQERPQPQCVETLKGNNETKVQNNITQKPILYMNTALHTCITTAILLIDRPLRQ